MNPRPGGFQIALLLYLLTVSVFHVHAAPLSTTQNSTLSVPASTLAAAGLPGAANLVGTNFMVARVEDATSQGGRASLMSRQEWVRRYNGGPSWNCSSEPHEMLVQPNGNVCITGSLYQSGKGDDFATISYAANGTPLWTNYYDGPVHGNDVARTIAGNKSGDVWVVGDSIRFATNSDLTAVVTIRYASNGLPLWTNRFITFETNSAYPWQVIVDSAGNAYVRFFIGHPETDSVFGTVLGDVIVKCDPFGSVSWTKEFGFSDPDENHIHSLRAMALDSTDALFITGTSASRFGNPNQLVKFASDGTALWTNSSALPIGNLLSLDLKDNLLRTTEGWSNSAVVYTVTKCSNTGAKQWATTVRGPQYSGGDVPQVLSDLQCNTFVIGGSADVPRPGLYDLLKLNPEGLALWTGHFAFGLTNGMIHDSVVDSAGNLYVVGYATLSDGTSQCITLKYSGNGAALWTNRFDEAFPRGIGVDAGGNVYVTGKSDRDFVTVKYSDSLVYIPPKNFTGSDTVTYVLADNLGNSATRTVEVAVAPGSFKFSPAMITLTPANIQFEVEGAPGTNSLVLEASEDLVTWQPISTNAVSNGSTRLVHPAPAGRTQRFYRVLQQQ